MAQEEPGKRLSLVMTCASRDEPAHESPLPNSGTLEDREHLITSHLELAQLLAKRFANRGESLDDLVQVASLALVQAADRFDARRGVSFSTFASRTINGELKRYFRDKGWLVRPPRAVQELYVQIDHYVAELTQQLGRSPSIAEISAACGRREDDVLLAIEAGRGYRAVSLDGAGAEPSDVVDQLPATAEIDTSPEQPESLSLLLVSLPEREREILHLRFVEQLSQTAIAEKVGLSQMHVSRILRAAVDDLRRTYLTES